MRESKGAPTEARPAYRQVVMLEGLEFFSHLTSLITIDLGGLEGSLKAPRLFRHSQRNDVSRWPLLRQ
jgi:hypothetical protein